MARQTRFVVRSLLDGLIDVYHSSPILALLSFLLIAFISSVMPLAIFWLTQCLFGYSLIPIESTVIRTLLTLWSSAEVLFLIYQAYLYSIIQLPGKAPQIPIGEREQMVTAVLASVKSVQETLSKWFLDSRFETINRRDITSWLAYVFYAKSYEALEDDEYEYIDSLISQLEAARQVKLIDEKPTQRLPYMKHILDPVRVIFRPLVYYIVTDTLCNRILATTIFRRRGYKFVEIGKLKFWTHFDEESGEEKEEEPIIFFHGIGAGLLMYQPFFKRIHRQFSRRRRIILISLRCICMRYPSLNDIPTMSETTDSIREIFAYYKLNKAIFIGHSYGTACLSWIVKQCPELISRLIFIDPICFEMFEPYVIYNFVYRQPSKLGHLYMFYFVCREMGISHVIGRHFWWTENNLFIEQIHSSSDKSIPIHVFLSGRDCIINSHRIREHMIDKQVDYHWAPTLSHGGYMHDPNSWEVICQWIM